MTPKQKYDERKRLRLENDLRAEQKRKDQFDRQEEMDEEIKRFFADVRRMADAAELWADMQKDTAPVGLNEKDGMLQP
ncbi:hypothetical protein [Mesorhizobium sp.]|uniref:hypothetical protein n=1 Tax=Mesorhizobium sp. TaxID=1871066 RepID=UPI000FE71D16|nr:hypothetical protein [Mesorhizobium sp.]RWG34000.1 MAG: hypothetical protein EOQ60_10290 [Mesorhizobium sp.]